MESKLGLESSQIATDKKITTVNMDVAPKKLSQTDQISFQTA